jgi:5-methylcytosine-specific restriction protein A
MPPQPWTGSDRKQRLPPNWTRTVTAIWQRDGSRCQQCGRLCHRGQGDGEVHHITDADDHRMSNLQLLCTPCHAVETATEAAQARRRLIALRKRPTEAHPAYKPE